MQFQNNLIFQKHVKRFHLYDIVKVVQFIETGKRTVVIGGWRWGGRGIYCLMGIESQSCKMMDGWQ